MDETQAVKDDLDKDDLTIPLPKYTQVNYLFPCLVYVWDKLNSGELDKAEFEAVLRRNVEEHGHEDYRFPEDFYDILPNHLNHIGWKVFEIPRLIAEQKAAAAERRAQKAAAHTARKVSAGDAGQAGGGQKKTGTGDPAGTASKPSQPIKPDADNGAAETLKKKIIVVRKKTG
ncbi:hypothetical protein FACS1894151_09800 [Spirochaetia bacterium]|nr:hypothetical protein FACS1894151_09800 [Spirochaetia bacterium]